MDSVVVFSKVPQLRTVDRVAAQPSPMCGKYSFASARKSWNVQRPLLLVSATATVVHGGKRRIGARGGRVSNVASTAFAAGATSSQDYLSATESWDPPARPPSAIFENTLDLDCKSPSNEDTKHTYVNKSQACDEDAQHVELVQAMRAAMIPDEKIKETLRIKARAAVAKTECNSTPGVDVTSNPFRLGSRERALEMARLSAKTRAKAKSQARAGQSHTNTLSDKVDSKPSVFPADSLHLFGDDCMTEVQRKEGHDRAMNAAKAAAKARAQAKAAARMGSGTQRATSVYSV